MRRKKNVGQLNQWPLAEKEQLLAAQEAQKVPKTFVFALKRDSVNVSKILASKNMEGRVEGSLKIAKIH